MSKKRSVIKMFFLLQPLIPPFLIPEHQYEKRNNQNENLRIKLRTNALIRKNIGPGLKRTNFGSGL